MSLNRDTFYLARRQWNISAALRDLRRAGFLAIRAKRTSTCSRCQERIEIGHPIVALTVPATPVSPSFHTKLEWIHLGCLTKEERDA